MTKKILSMLLVISMSLSLGSVLAAESAPQDAVRVGEDYTYSRVIYSKDGSEITSLETGNITAKIKVKSATKSAPQFFAVLRYDNGKLAAAGVDSVAPASISTVQEYEATVNVPSTENTKLVTVLWDNAKDMNAVCPASVSTNVTAGLKEVYINGKKLETFDSDTLEYTYQLENPTLTSLPKVSYVPVNNTDKVEVTEAKDFPGYTKIKVTPFGGTAKEYKINWTYVDPISADKEILFLNGTNLTDVATRPSLSWTVTNRGMVNSASSEITVTNEPVKVDVTIGSNPVQKAFIVVRPVNGTNGIDNKVIVNPDGTEISTKDYSSSFKTATWNSETQKVDYTYYQISTTQPVSYKDTATGATQTFWVGYELNGSTNAGDTGAYVFNREPKTEMLALRLENSTIKNAEWIPYSSNTASEGGTFTFYVGQSAIVDVYTTTSNSTYSSDTPSITSIDIKADGVPVVDVVKASEKALIGFTEAGAITKACFNDGYKEYYDLMLAYFDYKGYVDGIHYNTALNNRLMVYDCIHTYDSIANTGSTDLTINFGNWITIGLSKTRQKVSAGGATNVVKPTEDARLWNNFGTPEASFKTKEELIELFKLGEVYSGPIDTTKQWVSNDYTLF